MSSSSTAPRAGLASGADPNADRMMAAGTTQSGALQLVLETPPAPAGQIDRAALERQLREAFAALGANRRYPEPGEGEVDRQLHTEARILRLLFACGAQPVIDVRTMPWRSAGYPGRTVMTTIGFEAGCPDPSTVTAAIEALCANGLIKFSRQMLTVSRRYAALERQADIAAVVSTVGPPVQGRGTLCLSAIGDRLCRRCAAAGPTQPVRSGQGIPRPMASPGRSAAPSHIYDCPALTLPPRGAA